MLTAASLILLILATVLSLGGQPAVQAQDNQGAIGNLSVSSPDPGQLVAAWSALAVTSKKNGYLEVWPESHWLGFALRQPDVLQSYTTC